MLKVDIQISFTTSVPLCLTRFFNFPTMIAMVIARITPPKTREITSNSVEFPEVSLFPFPDGPPIKKTIINV